MNRTQLYLLCGAPSILAGVGAGIAIRALGYEYLTTGVASLTIILVSCVTSYWLGRRVK